MTVQRVKRGKKIILLLEWLTVIATVVLSFRFAREIKDGVLFGMRLGALEVIPAIFPFFVLSDYICCSGLLDFKKTKKLFEKIFGISGDFCTPFILGCLFGFPIGAKCCSQVFSQSSRLRYDCERAVCLSSNPSLSFCAFAVGLGCLSDLKLGIVIYFSMILSTILVGLMARGKCVYSPISDDIPRQSFDFATSIKSAGLGSMAVCSFIAFFSAIVSLVENLFSSEFAGTVVSCFLEVGNACSRIGLLGLGLLPSLMVYGFAIGFSGISVILQARAALPSDVRISKLCIFKMAEGVVCSVITPILYLIIT